jgi:transcriptional regulator with XRE-family HTH domain
MNNVRHWTSESVEDFVYQISSDFVGQIETKLEKLGRSYTELAEHIGVSPSRVSQVLNNPGNMTLESTARYARAIGMKVALVAYDDADPTNNNGPINAEVFTRCWEYLGSPRDLFSVIDLRLQTPTFVLTRQDFFYRPVVPVEHQKLLIRVGGKNEPYKSEETIKQIPSSRSAVSAVQRME